VREEERKRENDMATTFVEKVLQQRDLDHELAWRKWESSKQQAEPVRTPTPFLPLFLNYFCIIIFLLSYFTALLYYSIVPFSHYSIFPLCHFPIVPLLHYFIIYSSILPTRRCIEWRRSTRHSTFSRHGREESLLLGQVFLRALPSLLPPSPLPLPSSTFFLS
jgi:hypothetical protein